MPPRIIRIAHRGASGLYPENTLLAYRQAYEAGVDAIEIDVHRTRDDQLVVIHDPTLDRTTTGKGRVRDLTLAQIQTCDAGQGERVPSLAEVIQWAAPTPLRLCVEIKGDTETEELEIAEAIVCFLKDADFIGRSILTSFSPVVLLKARAVHPAVATMLDPSPQDGSLTPRQICEQTLAAGANCLSFDFEFVTQAVVDECQLTGLALWPWAPNTPADIASMVRLGVPGIMTDRPDVLNKVLNDTAI